MNRWPWSSLRSWIYKRIVPVKLAFSFPEKQRFEFGKLANPHLKNNFPLDAFPNASFCQFFFMLEASNASHLIKTSFQGTFHELRVFRQGMRLAPLAPPCFRLQRTLPVAVAVLLPGAWWLPRSCAGRGDVEVRDGYNHGNKLHWNMVIQLYGNVPYSYSYSIAMGTSKSIGI